MNCSLHPEVPAIGVCVSCRRVVCDSCSTRLQGRNFCTGCLARRADDAAPEVALESGWFLKSTFGMLTLGSMALMASAFFGLGFFLYMIG
ncbi:MAG: hypothetical protein GY898_24460 [Proteobacteria bacterium]|nr:hypothetical protein [Pseudomonadota bacterium]